MQKNAQGQQVSQYFTTCYDGDVTGASNVNYGVSQLPSGEIIFANKRGLVIFNGKTWKFWTAMDSKQRPVELTKLLPVKNKIYSGGLTDIGVWQKEGKDYKYQSFAVGKYKDRQFNTITQVYKHKKWILFVSTPEIILTDGKKIIKIIKAPKRNIFFYLHYYQDDLLLSTNKSLLIWDEQSKGFIKIVEDKKIRTLVTELQGKKLEIFFRGGISLDGKALNLEAHKKILGKRVSQAQLYDEKRVLIGDRHHLYLLDHQSNILEKIYASETYIYQVFIDNKGNIWTANARGVCYVELKSPFRNLIVNKSVNSVKVNQDGLFAISANSSILHWLTNQGSLVNIPMDSKIYTLFDVGNHQFLVVTRKDILLINYKTKDIIKLLDTLVYYTICYVQEARQLYLATPQGIKVYGFNGQQLNKKVTIKSKNKAFSFLVEGNNIWIGFRSAGLLRLTTDTNFNIVSQKRFPLKSFNDNECVVRKVDGVIWANNPGGIFKFNPHQDAFEKIAVDTNNTGREVVFTHAITDKNKLYLTGHSNRQTAFGMAVKKGDTYKFDNTPFRRLEAQEFSELMTHQGKLYFATSKGLFSFDPTHQQHFDFHFSPIIRTQKSDSIRKYQDNQVNFQFFAPYYEAPEKTTFSHQLQGFDQEWSAWSPEYKKEYTYLPEGTYTFQVKAKNVYGKESKVATYTFTILPPWYRTWWAYALYGLMVLGLVVGGSMGYSRLRTRQIRRRNEELEQVVEVRTEEIRVQKEEIVQQAEELKITNEQIKTSNEALQTTNAALTEANEQIKKDSEEKVKIYLQEATEATSKLQQIQETLIQKGADTTQKLLANEINTAGELSIIQEKVRSEFPDFASKIDKALANKKITKVVWQVGYCFKLGKSPVEIAKILPLSNRTVSAYGSRLRNMGVLEPVKK